MMKLEVKLALFNLVSRLIFTALLLLMIPLIIERINLRQVDNELVEKREKIIDLISTVGIEPFLTSDSSTFGSFNILKEEFISLERSNSADDLNFIEVTPRMIENEEIEYRVLNYTFIVDNQKYLMEIGKSLASIQHTRKNINKVIIYFLALFIIATLITDLQYNRYLLRPLNKIIRKLNGISEPSLFDTREIKTTTFDFYQLDHALNDLMKRIDDLFRKEKDITVNISHELMTPVSILRSKLENLLLIENPDLEVSAKIEEALKTLHRLQTLINSLLIIARIESHQYLRGETVNINDVLREILEEIRPVADDRNILLEEFYKDEDFRIKDANRSLLFSMFYNVVNNAVKNTLPGGKVNVRSEYGKVLISDTGKGMTREQMNTLFSRFKTRNGSDGNGTGIGLAIAKSIADFHDVKISVASSPGNGSSFSFTFHSNS